MKAKVNKDKCFGCGGCVSSISDVFEFDDNGYAKVIVDEISDEETQKKVKDFVDNKYCPGDAISYENK